MFCRRVPG